MSTPRIYIFNPENDLALAFGRAGFTPPATAWQMHLSGEALPLWYASPGDRFHSFGINAGWLDDMRSRFGMDVDVASESEMSSGRFAAAPWGWSAYAVRLFADAGFPVSGLPDTEAVECMRQLSSRRLTMGFNTMLRDAHGIEAPVPVLVDSADMLRHLCESGTGYVKQPWSCSGRGVASTAGMRTDEVVRRFSGVIRRQGYVMWEAALDRIADFAMLFHCAGGKAVFHGYSMFSTDGGGHYGGNVLATQDEIYSDIAASCPEVSLQNIREAVADVLGRLVAPEYTGPVGVDMLSYRNQDGSVRVAPCIEVNLRCTMGFVAQGFSSRFLDSGSRGVLHVAPAAGVSSLEPPVVSSEGRLMAGSLVLSPTYSYAFCASVRMLEKY